MDERENRFQAGLESLEAGKPLADAQQGTPEQDAVLLSLAERLRMAQLARTRSTAGRNAEKTGANCL